MRGLEIHYTVWWYNLYMNISIGSRLCASFGSLLKSNWCSTLADNAAWHRSSSSDRKVLRFHNTICFAGSFWPLPLPRRPEVDYSGCSQLFVDWNNLWWPWPGLARAMLKRILHSMSLESGQCCRNVAAQYVVWNCSTRQCCRKVAAQYSSWCASLNVEQIVSHTCLQRPCSHTGWSTRSRATPTSLVWDWSYDSPGVFTRSGTGLEDMGTRLDPCSVCLAWSHWGGGEETVSWAVAAVPEGHGQCAVLDASLGKSTQDCIHISPREVERHVCEGRWIHSRTQKDFLRATRAWRRDTSHRTLAFVIFAVIVPRPQIAGIELVSRHKATYTAHSVCMN